MIVSRRKVHSPLTTASFRTDDWGVVVIFFFIEVVVGNDRTSSLPFFFDPLKVPGQPAGDN